MRRATPCPTLFPYTTLFRSVPEYVVIRHRHVLRPDAEKAADTDHHRLDLALATHQHLVDLPDRVMVEPEDRKSTRLNSSHLVISYAVFCLKKKTKTKDDQIH